MPTSKSLLFSFALLICVLFSGPVLKAVRSASPPSSPLAPSALPGLSPELYAEAADALRSGDLQQARQRLGEVAADHPGQAAEARLLEGLYAWEAGEHELAVEVLGGVSMPGGLLEDWRLHLLASAAAERGDAELAQATWGRLISDHSGSPLRSVAFLAAAELARDQGQPRLALELVARARREGVGGSVGHDLDRLAWRLGRELEDEVVEREAGRRLLIEAPFSADAREAAARFRALDGKVDESRFFTSRDVLRRAETFLDLKSLPAALTTLENMPREERELEWHLLKARALSRAGRGLEALDLLDTVVPSGARERAALEWERAQAAAEAARRGSAGRRLSATERQRLLELSHRHLASVARLHEQVRLTEDGLRRLYEDYLEAGLREPSLDALRLLQRLDPEDATGAPYLWETGWEEYRRGRLRLAVGYWTELEQLYPYHRDAHRGRYWKARALEALGDAPAAREVYRELAAAADTSDFYLRQSLARLGESPQWQGVVRTATAEAGPWPAEPRLARTKRMTDLGLDGLAAREIELLSGEVERRDLLALKAFLLARQGRQREGIILLREAFPALGGPYQASVPEEIRRAYYPLEHEETIRKYAERHELPAWLVAGIIRQESAFDIRATSPVGARGLMQLMPATARELCDKEGVPYGADRIYDPELNIRLGTAYFRHLLDRFDGNVELALAGYNGGPNRIARLWREAGPEAGLDDFLETLRIDESRNYVKRILVLGDSYRQLYPSLS
jgi:soluble lytic murein transglycosylase-like protein